MVLLRRSGNSNRLIRTALKLELHRANEIGFKQFQRTSINRSVSLTSVLVRPQTIAREVYKLENIDGYRLVTQGLVFQAK